MSLHPGRLSSDSLDAVPASSRSPPPMDFDQWSGTHEAIESDDERDIQEVVPHTQELTVDADKVNDTDKTLTIETPSPTHNMQESVSDADGGSVRSMPVVQVTEPSSPVPMSAQSTNSRFPPSPSTSLAPASALSGPRRNRNRATLDTRASNRLSGFFSSLIHRRDAIPATSADSSSPASPIANSSRGSSPAPSRPTTPPPRLPPPSLKDLGLVLSSLTNHINPSHANGPPSSGAFLKPHYLLLCHAQGLDVLPLLTPPAPQPYALIRRVAFKSVVVMEHRGVLVAIAGRRNGVRVYALEDIKRAVEWRIEVEVRREQERSRREEAKRGPASSISIGQLQSEPRASVDRMLEKQPMTPVSTGPSKAAARRSSISAPPASPTRTPTARRPKTAEGVPPTPSEPTPVGPPPAYTSSLPSREPEAPAAPFASSRPRATSLSDVLQGTLSRRQTGDFRVERTDEGDEDSKAEWASSDDEAINVVAAPSGSQALDERTSSMATGSVAGSTSDSNPRIEIARSQTASSIHRRSRPANLDLSLSLTRANSRATVAPPPSPTPTLLTLRQALTLFPQNNPNSTTTGVSNNGTDMDVDPDEDDDGDIDPSSPTTPTRQRISLAEALMESRLPELPPAGSRRPQEPILLGSGIVQEDGQLSSPRTSESSTAHTRRSTGEQSSRRRRRWSVLDGIFSHSPTSSQSSIPAVREGMGMNRVASPMESEDTHAERLSEATHSTSLLSRSQSSRIAQSESTATVRAPPPTRPSTSPGIGAQTQQARDRAATLAAIGNGRPPPGATPTSSARFLPRIITSAFQSRRSDDLPALPRVGEADSRKSSGLPPPPQAPAPKLEYAKLPGTKGAVLIKAVETAKKSFLAILCGENGEKVELFAGTYRTALQLSRTFILPDSPKSLELQLQGDDLVEVFLVFTQNVFGLEPATVRVREVRIGRAERRAARRRARGNRPDQPGEGEGESATADDDTAVNVTVVSAPSTSTADEGTQRSPLPASSGPSQSPNASQAHLGTLSASNSSEELASLAAAQNTPYTTFQQLAFAPNFPLATISDEYIIPPTYMSFLEYRNAHEPEVNGDTNVDLSQVQFSPPGLPVPAPSPPSRWLYRDPKGNIHGPWKASLMQAWYRDALLPPDLPVRREEGSEYILLRDLRLQCVDPTHPFRTAASASTPSQLPVSVADATKPLLSPTSLLAQPRQFGPPALFYSSRGGHSTSIVDARGRSVLKGRFMWTSDEEDEYRSVPVRLGDVKRLEAFDMDDRAVLVALRQGGLEVVDFGDALLRPGDHSRPIYPHFQPPVSSISRRGPFVWRIGTPLSLHPPVSSMPIATSGAKSAIVHRKKTSTGPAKSPRSDYAHAGDIDPDRISDEVLFLGRQNDEIYLCERRIGSFRILKLSPHASSPPF
ncbi:uncharacterized protein FIBRA_02964 [Fibroporia radiculosa]|uniref:GYF domain-containing protein n=1 Tax=Fibroporia radiculosa TaxID=599839 RepID=J4G3M5_9APHY|nr:uncharacterized protein FIBRA_02964 [Fibroporia radiculosa]CCM00918.1 predicted protein [Fibroporia radiculosa]